MVTNAPGYEPTKANFAHPLAPSFGYSYSAAADGNLAERCPHAVYMISPFHYRQSRFNYRHRPRPQVARNLAAAPLLAAPTAPDNKHHMLALPPATQVLEQAA